MSTPPAAPQPPVSPTKRKLLLGVAAIAFAAIGVSYATYWLTEGRYTVATDDAYVSGNVVQVSPQIAGTVVSVRADDTDYVQSGQPLVSIDDADTRLSLEQAKATYSQTLREVRAVYSTDGALAASASLQETNLARQQEDLARRQRLADTGAVSAEELKHARDAVQTAADQLNNARKQLEANRVLVDRTTPTEHPRVKLAAARLREAYLAWRRTVVPAPTSGQVARRSVQVGQRVTPGTPLMAVVPMDQLWVDANFKEGQLSAMRIGQPVTLTADLYGTSVVYHGKVVGLSAGTGSAFSLLPAQNATGNWIKVVQRLPVRITLDPAELKAHPLRVGLSMEASVTIKDQSGPQVSSGKQADTVAETAVFSDLDKDADALIDELAAEAAKPMPQVKTP